MKFRNIYVALPVLFIAACQPQTAVDSPAPTGVVSPAPVEVLPASAPAVTDSARASGSMAAAPTPAPASKSAITKSSPPARETESPAPTPTVANVVTAIPVEVQSPEKALSENDALALAKKNGCLACHAIDKKVFGPAWRDVAAKYRGDAGAEARLAEKIAKGGGGVWGNMPMPANPKISEVERRSLAKFVLSLK